VDLLAHLDQLVLKDLQVLQERQERQEQMGSHQGWYTISMPKILHLLSLLWDILAHFQQQL
jgi:hypothetical protein